ncbi:Hypothetical predicted protein [Lecanosticta acicola]|uniref:C2H2-type domain-containing protein n=1 Tax=Lecanosticta acicola TaxID=111012 RepID=A0AAI8YTL8_9PEZI|nr:Hypothetical predicted protein [Lecanosticta acicola]
MAKRLREDSFSQQQPSPLETAAHTPKYAEFDEADHADTKNRMQCSLPPHKPLTFSSYQDYETHYRQSHTNRCLECRVNLPSAHFLELHIAENHDPIVATKRDSGDKTYSCFVEGCDKVCLEWKKRRSHLVDKHGFPKNYDFLIVNNGVDGRRSMLRPGIDAQGHRKSGRERRGSPAATDTTQTTEAALSGRQTTVSEQDVGEASPATAQTNTDREETGATNKSVDALTKSMSSLQFVPRSVTFGKRKGKSGFAKN